ncbi:MAG: hypothetical protein Q7R95_09705 [bacterium]|nr:hypothetical protein [bacterium]
MDPNFYYAARETEKYLQKIHESKFHEYDIVAICGGLSFLHALHKDIRQTIYIVDKEIECLEYATLIINLICHSTNMEHFKSLVMKRINDIQYIYESNNNKLYEKFYSHLYFCEKENCLKSKIYDKIKIYETEKLGKEKFTYHWNFGRFNFENEDKFQEMKNVLANSNIIFIPHTFNDFVHEYNFNNKNILFLASNIDNSYYDKENIIFENIYSFNGAKNICFISWDRYFTTNLESAHHNCIHKIKKLIKSNEHIYEIKTYLGYQFLDNEFPNNTIQRFDHFDIDGIISKFSKHRIDIPEEALLYHISLDCNNGSMLINFFSRISKNRIKKFIYLQMSKIISIDKSIDLMKQSGILLSHKISSLEFYGLGIEDPYRGYIVCLELLGNY